MREGGEWGSLQRRIARFVRSFSSGRPTLA